MTLETLETLDTFKTLESKKNEEEMLDEAGIVRVATFYKVKAEAKAKERTDGEVSDEIRARMEAERLERDREEF